MSGKSKHGMHGTRPYTIWASMKQRCINPNNQSYMYYGGRGIKVCDQWMSFEPFYAWAETNGYSNNLTLDRIDTNGNYTPTNCRWATLSQQRYNRNRKRNKPNTDGGYVGVNFRKDTGAFATQVGKVRLGCYSTAYEAAVIREKWVVAHPELCAFRNFPNEHFEPLFEAPSNLKRNNTTGFVGVQPHQGKWRARICKNKITYEVGCFNSPEEANEARKKFLKSLDKQ